MVYDALINGLSSHGIRQRLLENRDLNLENAVEKARSMELAQEKSEFYSLNQECRNNLTATVADKSSTLLTTDNVSEAIPSVSKLCTFCGRSIHARSMCPAKNAVCFKCRRRGHFANVCKLKVFRNINARVSNSTLCVIHETPNCLTQASLTAKIADTEVSALIDSGNSMSFIIDTAKRLNIGNNPYFDNV